MIPSIIHFVWVGGALPATQRDKMKAWKLANPTFRVILWCDRYTINGYPWAPSEVKEWSEPRLSELPNVECKDYQELLLSPKGWPCANEDLVELVGEEAYLKLYRILLCEIYLPQGNYATTSDIVRLLCLGIHGGFYFDFDEQPADLSTLGGGHTLYVGGTIARSTSLANNAMAANKKHKFVKSYLLLIVRAYYQGGGGPDVAIETRFKRHPLATKALRAKALGVEHAKRSSGLFNQKQGELISSVKDDGGYGVHAFSFFSETVLQQTGPNVMKAALEESGYLVSAHKRKLYRNLPGDWGAGMGAAHGWWRLPPKARDNWLNVVHMLRYAMDENPFFPVLNQILNDFLVPVYAKHTIKIARQLLTEVVKEVTKETQEKETGMNAVEVQMSMIEDFKEQTGGYIRVIID